LSAVRTVSSFIEFYNSESSDLVTVFDDGQKFDGGAGVYLDFLTRGWWWQCQGITDQASFANVPLKAYVYYILYIVMYDVNMTTFDWGELTLLG